MKCPKCGSDMTQGRRGWMCEDCGERLSSHSDARPPTQVKDSLDSSSGASRRIVSLHDGRYSITETLGEGGMGVVYRAIDTQLRRAVAVKGIRPALLGVPSAEQRFLHEAQAVASIEHPNVIRIYDYFAEHELLYIAMEFFDGVSLQRYVEQAGAPDPTKVKSILTQITDALSAVHARGLVHRDVKPSNILVNAKGRVKLIDFGLVRGQGTLVTRTGAYLGGGGYTAPEQETDAASADARADIYSVGGVLYFLLTGGEHPPRVLIAETVPDPYSHVVLKCLAANRDERFSSVAELRRALDMAVAPAREEARAGPARRRGGRARSAVTESEPTDVARSPRRGAVATRRVPESRLFARGADSRDWDIGYLPLWFLGLVTLWWHPMVRMTKWLGVLNGRTKRDFSGFLGEELRFQCPWKALKATLSVFGLGVFVGVLAELLTEGEDGVAMLVSVGAGFYLGGNLHLLCWLRAVQDNEHELLERCVDRARGPLGPSRIGIAEVRSKRWVRVWVIYTAMVLTGWVFGITFHFVGMYLYLSQLRQYAETSDQAYHELKAILDSDDLC